MVNKFITLLKTFLQIIIEIIFPVFFVHLRKQDTLLCCDCYEKIEFSIFPFNNMKQLEYLDEIVIVCRYQGVIKKLIHEFKYKSVINIGVVIAKLIYRSSNLPNCDLLVPIPIHKKKKSTRGFNQSEEIIKALSKLTLIPTANLIIKSKNTKSQMSIRSKDERKKNLNNSFKINKALLDRIKINQEVMPQTVVLVDDVVTTGSTLDECAKVLKNAGIKKVIGLVLAQR